MSLVQRVVARSMGKTADEFRDFEQKIKAGIQSALDVRMTEGKQGRNNESWDYVFLIVNDVDLEAEIKKKLLGALVSVEMDQGDTIVHVQAPKKNPGG